MSSPIYDPQISPYTETIDVYVRDEFGDLKLIKSTKMLGDDVSTETNTQHLRLHIHLAAREIIDYQTPVFNKRKYTLTDLELVRDADLGNVYRVVHPRSKFNRIRG